MALVSNERSCKASGLANLVKKECSSTQNAYSTNMQQNEGEFCTDRLPNAFLQSLRTLFDILDDGRRGYVHISEIESRWQGAGTRGLPSSVVECLRRVTPSHGCLTFGRFVVGLRQSMLNAGNDNSKCLHSVPSYLDGPKPPHTKIETNAPVATGFRLEQKVRPLGISNMSNIQRATSGQSRSWTDSGTTGACKSGKLPHNPSVPLPQPADGPVHQRSGRSVDRCSAGRETGGGAFRTESYVHKKSLRQNTLLSIESLALESPQLRKQSPIVPPCLPRSQSEMATGFGSSRRHWRSRDEQRRHTISNGVDYGMLKQMKELEQEKDSLLAGLEVVERAHDWFQTQIQSVSERQRLVGQSNLCVNLPTESSTCRMNVLLPKLLEVNRCLNDLISSSGKQSCSPSTPSTISQSTKSSTVASHQAIVRLKDQNRLLTQEVTEKSEQITQLEQEKSALIKQLFEARGRSMQESSMLDSTFI